jgi:23S rRNA (cytosine1962-C5)-methyltransferase
VATVHLARGRVQPVWAGHPWVYAQAIDRVEGAPAPGDVVDVVDHEDRFQGRGYWSPRSAIPVRIATRDRSDPLDGPWIGRRIEAARALRRRFGLPSVDTTGYRLVNAEGDGLPGLVVDVLGDVAVVQLLTIGMKRREDDVFAHVARIAEATTVIEVANEKTAMLEGFDAQTHVVRGPERASIDVLERGLAFEVPGAITQKTGFYFDQRDNRAMVESIASGMRVLDLYTYVGAFALFAARGGAQTVVAVDSAIAAITNGARTAHRHGFASRVTFERADAKDEMERLHRRHETFDLVILDPPKLAPSIKHLDRARMLYRKLNADAARLVAPGGYLLSCSCSGAMELGDFKRTAVLGARDANRDLVLVRTGEQGVDHPSPAAFPEARYLKACLFRVTP